MSYKKKYMALDHVEYALIMTSCMYSVYFIYEAILETKVESKSNYVGIM